LISEQSLLEAQYNDIKPRLIKRQYIQSLLSMGNFKELISRFIDWFSYTEYLIFKGTHVHTYESRFKAVKSSKRGNDVYHWRVKKRFEDLEDLPGHHFFDYKDRSKRHKTRCLFVTLTYRRFLNPDSFWGGRWTIKLSKSGNSYIAHEKRCLCVSCCYNRFITRLRRKYGNVSAIRVWESHKDGVPHVHVVLLFEDHEFETFFHNGVWRVQGKHELERYWEFKGQGLGFIDVEAISNTKGAIRYITKYLNKLHKWSIDNIDVSKVVEGPNSEYQPTSLKSLESKASVFTLALMWGYRKRAFSISGNFIDLIRRMHNSNFSVVGQVDLSGDPVWIWKLEGFYGGQLPGVSGVPWSTGLELSQVRAMRKGGSWSDRV